MSLQGRPLIPACDGHCFRLLLPEVTVADQQGAVIILEPVDVLSYVSAGGVHHAGN